MSIDRKTVLDTPIETLIAPGVYKYDYSMEAFFQQNPVPRLFDEYRIEALEDKEYFYEVDGRIHKGRPNRIIDTVYKLNTQDYSIQSVIEIGSHTISPDYIKPNVKDFLAFDRAIKVINPKKPCVEIVPSVSSNLNLTINLNYKTRESIIELPNRLIKCNVSIGVINKLIWLYEDNSDYKVELKELSLNDYIALYYTFINKDLHIKDKTIDRKYKTNTAYYVLSYQSGIPCIYQVEIRNVNNVYNKLPNGDIEYETLIEMETLTDRTKLLYRNSWLVHNPIPFDLISQILFKFPIDINELLEL